MTGKSEYKVLQGESPQQLEGEIRKLQAQNPNARWRPTLFSSCLAAANLPGIHGTLGAAKFIAMHTVIMENQVGE